MRRIGPWIAAAVAIVSAIAIAALPDDDRARPRLLYVDETETRLDPPSLEPLLRFARAHRFTELALYDTHQVLPALAPALERAIRRMHADGLRVVAVAGAVEQDPRTDVDRIAGYLEAHRDPAARFDGVVTEYEFYQPGSSWPTYDALLDALAPLARDHDLLLATYLGWPSPEQARSIAARADRVHLHAYRRDPHEAAEYLRSRLRDLATAPRSRPLEVWPIFSSERRDRERMDEHDYLGAWIDAQPPSSALDRLEAILEADLGAPPDGIVLGGFAYYAYDDLARDLAEDGDGAR